MDSFTWNKIAGAVLGTCTVGMGIGIVANGIFHPGPPQKPGYALPNPKPETAAGEAQPGVTPVAVRLAKADPKKGEADAKVCSACHNFAEGAGAKIGPDLYGVVDRPKGKEPGFNYSAGMKAKGGNWTYADLDTFLTKPAAFVSGTLMGYPGEENADKRADIISYLRTLAKTPVPLPQVSEGEKKQAAGAKTASNESTDKAAGEATGEADFLKTVGSADAKKGQSDAQVCSACHNFKKGGTALIGPPLWNVVNRKKGSVAGYDYSEGLKKKGGEWTIADLNAWLTDPAKYIPGTKMGYPGEANEKKRAEIIAFLRTLSDQPVALPNTQEGAKKAEAPHAGETKNMSPEAKPGDQRPPEPPNPPGSPQPTPKLPEQSVAPNAPHEPDERRPGMPAPPPTHDEARPAPAAPSPPPAAKAEASPPRPAAQADAATPSAEAGPEPFQASDPQYPAQPAEPPPEPKQTSAAPSLAPGGDSAATSDAAPEPPSAPDPSDNK